MYAEPTERAPEIAPVRPWTTALGKWTRGLLGYPERKTVSIAEAADVTVTPVHDAKLIQRQAPRTIEPEISREFHRCMTETNPPTFLAKIDGGLVGNFGLPAVFAGNGDLIEELSLVWFDGSSLTHPYFSFRRRRREILDRRAVLNLLSLGGDNYAHWTLDVLPRLLLALEAGVDLEMIDCFLVNGPKRNYKVDSLQSLGVNPEHMVFVNGPELTVRGEIVYAPSYVGRLPGRSPWVIESVRRLALPPTIVGASPQRIFISRANAAVRRLTNESAVWEEILRPLGFARVILEELNWREQVAIFSGANVVLAPHGAGLANLAYCQPGTRVLELYHPRYVHVQYWRIAGAGGLHYYYALGEGESPPGGIEESRHLASNFSIAPPKLRKLLQLANVSSPSDSRARDTK